jgi:pimeloyl-ACP methyl ester carboxylesterase
MGALKLDRPVLAGHSLAGEELSSIGSRYPEKVTGLIYLDAGYGYAYYDRAHGELIFDMFDLKKRLDALQSGAVQNQRQFMQDMLISVSQLEKDLRESKRRMASVPELHPPLSPPPPIIMAINLGGQKYTEIHVPILAIFACPHNFAFDPALRNNPTAKAAIVANDLVITSRQAVAFAAGIPSAHVVRLPNADHYVFRSNEADVLREMNTFLAKLP